MSAHSLGKTLTQIWHWIARPPYTGLPYLVWLYAIFACVAMPEGGVFTGHLFGFDDHVRMTQVLNWVNGAGWYDRTIMRANPPEGFHTLWTRIVDIPIAAVVLVAQEFVTQRTAALVASVVVPFAQLALLFVFVAPYFARPIIGKRKARLIVLFLMFTSVMNHKFFTISGFFPGEASHHSWYILLDLLLFGATARIAMGAYGLQPALMMGLSTGLLLAVGIEGFPMIAGACALLAGIAWHFERPSIAKSGMQAMTSGALLSLVLLPMNQPPAQLFDISFSEPSILGPILIGTAALFLGIEKLILESLSGRKALSLMSIILTAFSFGIFLILAFPQILNGPAAGLSPTERAMALHEHYEAFSLYKVAQGSTDFIGLIAPTVIALIAGLVAITQATSQRRRASYIAYFGITALSAGMVELFSRYNHYAMTTACTWLLWAWNKINEKLPKNRHHSLAAFGLFIFLGPFWMLLLPAIDNNVPFVSQVLLYPAKLQTLKDPCDMLDLATYINDHYSKDAILIVPNWDTSRFLYYTDVRINFVANYPSHDLFIDNEDFFNTRDQENAKGIARRHHLDLVAVCRVPLYLSSHYPMNQQMLLGLLQAGMPPDWLKLVDTQREVPGNYILYEVDQSALAKGK